MALVQALNDLGYSPEQGERPVRGYRGQTVTADPRCLRRVVIWASLEFETGAYELVTDLDLEATHSCRAFSGQAPSVVFNSVLSASNREGFQVAEERVTQDGSIELVVTVGTPDLGAGARIRHSLSRPLLRN